MKVIAVKLDSPEAVARLEEAIVDAIGESTKDRLLRMVAKEPMIYQDANILDPLIEGFAAGAASFVEGANVPTILSSTLDEIRSCVAGTEAAFYVGTALFALSAIRLDIEEEAARKAKVDAQEYRIIEDEVPCRCRNPQCRKAIRARREADGQIEVNFLWNGQIAGNIHLDRDGVRSLVEQLLDGLRGA